MKKVILLSLMSSFAFVCHAQTDADKAAVNQVVIASNNSWNNHNYRDMSSYATEDVEVINPAGVLWKGRSDVQQSLQHIHDIILKTTAMTTIRTTTRFVNPSVALVTAIGKIGTFYPPNGVDNGTNKAGGNRVVSTLTIVKKNGKWLLAALQATDINEDIVKTDPLSKTKQ